MQIANFLIFYLIFSRIIELMISNFNTKKLLKKGAMEYFPHHYKFIVFFHVFFIIYFLIKSFQIIQIDNKLLIIFFFIQVLRYKIIFDLGKNWTTRIIVSKNIPLVKTGFYRFLKHPNYVVVYIEVFLICLIFYDYRALLIFTLLNQILILVRIYYENKANGLRKYK